MSEKKTKLNETLLKDWLLVSRIIKNERLVDIPYTEALVLYLLLMHYPQNVSVKYLIETSKMLKSQMNRTLKKLKQKEWIDIQNKKDDLRCKEIILTDLGKVTIQRIHNHSLDTSQKILEILGEEDSKEVIRIFEKVIQCQKELVLKNKKSDE